MTDIVERLTELLVSQTAPTRADTLAARDTITKLRAEVEGVRRVNGRMATALDMADNLIERGYGVDVPPDWHTEISAVSQARAALGDNQ